MIFGQCLHGFAISVGSFCADFELFWECLWDEFEMSDDLKYSGDGSGPLHLGVRRMHTHHCIARLRKARPSTGVAFLCTPTDIHVCTDASDAEEFMKTKAAYDLLSLPELSPSLSLIITLSSNYP